MTLELHFAFGGLLAYAVFLLIVEAVCQGGPPRCGGES